METWVDLMDGALQDFSPPKNWSIWRIPISIRMVNNDAYTPRIISIGPLHHGRQSLLSMETHKLSYLLSFLHRTPNARESLDACAMSIEDFDKRVRDCYAEKIPCTVSELAKMLLLDACFILELLLRYAMVDLRRHDDPIFNTPWMILALRHDLALLENQIPFFVLQWLFDRAVSPSSIGQSLSSLPELALSFFESSNFRWNEETFRVIATTGSTVDLRFPHLLGLIHNFYLPFSQRTPAINNNGGLIRLKDATLLREAGVEFQRSTGEDINLFNLKFENGVFKIPPFYIHSYSESFFRNLIAYEQFCPSTAQYVTSYFYLMSCLITAPKDAELLSDYGILENDLGGWEDVALHFNNMSKQIVLNDFRYAGLCQALNQYRIWGKYLARRDYFRNPLSIISFMAAFIMLSLVGLQAMYQVLAYYRS